ncbi:MAG TPA: TetR/AcrR family transcriptional regulator [Pseudonocardiaceae bacterium]|nr:TetR/AcrR family transcriptional regulator [Pseudonocardiaceae bacterium]
MTVDPLADPPGLRADARRNRARVLRAAQEAFAAEGLAVPLDEIARRAGVGAGTVYRHFPTKEALFETIVLGRVREMGDRIRRWAADPDPGPAFFSMLTELGETGVMKRDLVDALTAAGIDVSGPLAEARTGIRSAMATLLARAQEAGAVRPDVTVDDLGTLLAALFLAANGPGTGSATRAVAVLADGLRTLP